MDQSRVMKVSQMLADALGILAQETKNEQSKRSHCEPSLIEVTVIPQLQNAYRSRQFIVSSRIVRIGPPINGDGNDGCMIYLDNGESIQVAESVDTIRLFMLCVSGTAANRQKRGGA